MKTIKNNVLKELLGNLKNKDLKEYLSQYENKHFETYEELIFNEWMFTLKLEVGIGETKLFNNKLDIKYVTVKKVSVWDELEEYNITDKQIDYINTYVEKMANNL